MSPIWIGIALGFSAGFVIGGSTVALVAWGQIAQVRRSLTADCEALLARVEALEAAHRGRAMDVERAVRLGNGGAK